MFSIPIMYLGAGKKLNVEIEAGSVMYTTTPHSDFLQCLKDEKPKRKNTLWSSVYVISGILSQGAQSGCSEMSPAPKLEEQKANTKT